MARFILDVNSKNSYRIMDARTSYFSNEIKELQFKFKSLRNDHEELKKKHEKLQKQVKTLKEKDDE